MNCPGRGVKAWLDTVSYAELPINARGNGQMELMHFCCIDTDFYHKIEKALIVPG